MSAMCITVRSITVGEGRKPSVVMTTEGLKLKCFPDKIARFGIEIGASYNVETDEYTNEWGVSHTIVKAKRVSTGALASAPARDPYKPGVYRPNGANSAPAGGYYRPTSPVDAERMFVTKLLGDAITSGRVTFQAQHLEEATRLLRELWKRTFGRDGIPLADAAE